MMGTARKYPYPMVERLYVALDLELTGVEVDRDTIIEIGAVRFQGDRMLDTFHTLVNPQRPIPLRIQQITGITDRDVSAAPDLEQVLPELRAFVDRDVSAVVAHTIWTDLGFLRAAGVDFQRPALDTFELAGILLPGMVSYGLTELCRVLGIDADGPHRALSDAQATARLLMALQTRIRALPPWVVDQIVASGQDSHWPPLELFAAAQETGRGAPVPTPHAGWPLSAPKAVGDTLPQPPRTVAEERITAAFDAGGPLAALMGPDYERRPGQVQMARLAMAALNRGDHLLVEAGTGTGKSLAYLLPAALWSVGNGVRVVIATNTIPLQDQLQTQEIPRVHALLSALESAWPPLQAAVLKGRSNYLCLRRLQLWRTDHRLDDIDLQVLAKVLIWLLQTETGDVSELFLPTAAERAVWTHLCSDPYTCTPERCSAAHTEFAGWPSRDFYWLAHRRAELAHLLVINHALLVTDVAAGGRLLPAYSHLVVDESHRLEEAITEQMTFRVNQNTLRALLSRCSLRGELANRLRGQAELEPLATRLGAQARRSLPPLQELMETLVRFSLRQPGMRQEGKYAQRLLLDDGVRAQPRWSQIEVEWESVSDDLQLVADLLQQLIEALTAARWQRQEPTATYLSDLQGLHGQFGELLTQLDQILFQPTGADQNSVCWLELQPESREISLCRAPIYVGDLVEAGLLHARRSVIFTGATLRTGDGFGFVQDRLRLGDVESVTIDSPFDYKANALLYMPTDLAPPDAPGYQQGVEQAVIGAARAARGQTLVLFTSYSHLRTTASAIRAPLDQEGIVVLEHGIGSRQRLLREFRETEKAVLLGTRSFWEGIDLPGNDLQCLLIVRLPFAVPVDPLVAARSRELDDPFADYTLPDAILRFRQGFGRLIRRATDRGVIVLLDNRIWRRKYGASFLEALPECTVRHAPLMNLHDEVVRWLQPGRA